MPECLDSQRGLLHPEGEAVASLGLFAQASDRFEHEATRLRAVADPLGECLADFRVDDEGHGAVERMGGLPFLEEVLPRLAGHIEEYRGDFLQLPLERLLEGLEELLPGLQ